MQQDLYLRAEIPHCRDLEDLKQVLLTNVVGTFAVTKALLPMLKQGKKKVIINMSSDAGCLTQNASFIHDNRPSDAGMALSYRTSKVAVNMGELSLLKSTLLFSKLQPHYFAPVICHTLHSAFTWVTWVTMPEVCYAVSPYLLQLWGACHALKSLSASCAASCATSTSMACQYHVLALDKLSWARFYSDGFDSLQLPWNPAW